MNEMHLKDWLAQEGVTQTQAADLMGCTQGAISHMVKAGRDIFIVLENGIAISHFEKKQPGRRARVT